MLNLGFDIDLDIKKTRIPLHFVRKNECVHCGAKNSLVFVDKFGRDTKKEINAFDHIKCKACGRIYSIDWEPDNDGKMYPSAIEYNIPKQFSKFIFGNQVPKNASTEGFE